MIGKLEELTLLGCLRAGDGASATQVFDEMAKGFDGGKMPTFGAVYTTLSRMAAKGFLVETAFQDASGQKRRGFSVAPEGRTELNRAVQPTARLGGFALAGGLS